MGIGKSKSAAIFAGALVAALSFGGQPGDAFERRSGIWRTLRAGGFSGAMDEDAYVRRVTGVIAAKGKRFRLMEFRWEQSKKNTVGFPHAQYRLLVFEERKDGLSYLGSYQVQGGKRPQIRGQKIFYPFKDIEVMGVKVSKEISFENGPPLDATIGWATGSFYR